MILRATLAVAYPTGRASHAGQVKGDDPDNNGYPGPPGWGFGVGLTTPHSKKLLLRKSSRGISWIDLMMMDGKVVWVTWREWTRTGQDAQKVTVTKVEQRNKLDRFNDDGRKSCLGHLESMEEDRIGCPKRSSLKNCKGRDEKEDPGKDGEKKYKEIFKCW